MVCVWLRSRLSATRRIDGERADGPAQRRREPGVFLVRPLRRASPVIAGDERHDFDLVRIEATEVAVPDQVVRVPVMALVADMGADVVQQRRELQPLAFAIGEAVDGACLIEDRQREPDDLLRMLRVVVAPFGELERSCVGARRGCCPRA